MIITMMAAEASISIHSNNGNGRVVQTWYKPASW